MDATVIAEWDVREDRHEGSSDIWVDMDVLVPGEYVTSREAREAAVWRAEYEANGEVENTSVLCHSIDDGGIVYTIRVHTLRYW